MKYSFSFLFRYFSCARNSCFIFYNFCRYCSHMRWHTNFFLRYYGSRPMCCDCFCWSWHIMLAYRWYFINAFISMKIYSLICYIELTKWSVTNYDFPTHWQSASLLFVWWLIIIIFFNDISPSTFDKRYLNIILSTICHLQCSFIDISPLIFRLVMTRLYMFPLSIFRLLMYHYYSSNNISPSMFIQWIKSYIKADTALRYFLGH